MRTKDYHYSSPTGSTYSGRIEQYVGGAWIFVHPQNLPLGVWVAIAGDADTDLIPGYEGSYRGTRYRVTE